MESVAVKRHRMEKSRAKMQENPVISDWVRSSEGALKGCLAGGWRSGVLALRGWVAAGA